MQSVYLVLPAYNESKYLPKTIQKILKEGYHNIIVVDDGSQDETSKLMVDFPVIYLRHAVNCGVGAAIQTGIRKALSLDADYIVTIDADGQHHPNDIKAILKPLLENKVQVVLGSRFMGRNKIPLLRYIFNKIGNLITFLIAGLWVSDSQCGFRAFQRKAAQQIEIMTAGYEFSSEIISQIAYHNLSFKEVPVLVTYTKESMAKGQNFATGIKTAFKLIIRSLIR